MNDKQLAEQYINKINDHQISMSDRLVKMGVKK